MYIWRVELENIRSIRHLVWEISRDGENAAGWHVVLGDNGSGKSTFIRAVALNLNSIHIAALSLDWRTWLTTSATNGSIKVNILPDYRVDPLLRQPNKALVVDLHLMVPIERPKDNEVGRPTLQLPNADVPEYPLMEALTYSSVGWFNASYGPFRRFIGGDPIMERRYQDNPKLARHATAFGENVALPDSLQWLKDLKLRSYERDATASKLLQNLAAFINQTDFLPNGVQFSDVTSSGVHFKDGNGSEILIEELSDGYRSVLSMTLELLRQLTLAYPGDIFHQDASGKCIVVVPGVVLIDEIDAHLHPTWQRKIGQWFTTHFPQIQFIVTTHSPLVCQAAERGTIFKLPTPGTDEEGEMITGTERDRLLYGNILDAYSTEVFGSGITRSEKSQEMLDLLADLNFKEITKGLSGVEKQQQERLRAMLPTSSPLLNGHDSSS